MPARWGPFRGPVPLGRREVQRAGSPNREELKPEGIRQAGPHCLVGCLACLEACPENKGKLLYERLDIAFTEPETRALLELGRLENAGKGKEGGTPPSGTSPALWARGPEKIRQAPSYGRDRSFRPVTSSFSRRPCDGVGIPARLVFRLTSHDRPPTGRRRLRSSTTWIRPGVRENSGWHIRLVYRPSSDQPRKRSAGRLSPRRGRRRRAGSAHRVHVDGRDPPPLRRGGHHGLCRVLERPGRLHRRHPDDAVHGRRA